MAELLSSEDKQSYSKLREIYVGLKKASQDSQLELDNEMIKIRNIISSSTLFHTRALEDQTKYLSDAGRQSLEAHIDTKGSELDGQITALKSVYKTLFNDLNNIIAEGRPTIPGAEKVCLPCDMKSVFFVSRVPQGGNGPDMHYECAVCGRNNLNNNYRYDETSK